LFSLRAGMRRNRIRDFNVGLGRAYPIKPHRVLLASAVAKRSPATSTMARPGLVRHREKRRDPQTAGATVCSRSSGYGRCAAPPARRSCAASLRRYPAGSAELSRQNFVLLRGSTDAGDQ
jgi:hypothetical protein